MEPLLILGITFIAAPTLTHAVNEWAKDRRAQRAYDTQRAADAQKCPHIWNNWEEVARGPVIKKDRTTPVGFYIRQSRTCTICGQVELKDNRTL